MLQKVYDALWENPAELTIIGHTEEYYDRDGKLSYTHEICRKDSTCPVAENEETGYPSGTGNYLRICLE